LPSTRAVKTVPFDHQQADGRASNRSGSGSTSNHSLGSSTSQSSDQSPALVSFESNAVSQTWTAGHSLGLPNSDFDMDSSCWLLGHDFDLQALNSSIPASPQGLGVVQAASSNSCADKNAKVSLSCTNQGTPNTIYRSVQVRWHTRPSADVSSTIVVAGLEDQDEVDEPYRASLSNHLLPSISDNALPSADFLVRISLPRAFTRTMFELTHVQNLCIKLYFAKFHPMLPIIHASSFKPSSETALLVLSICSLGSLFVGSDRASVYGMTIFTKLNKAILASVSTGGTGSL
jgi:hypothetical protein